MAVSNSSLIRLRCCAYTQFKERDNSKEFRFFPSFSRINFQRLACFMDKKGKEISIISMGTYSRGLKKVTPQKT